MASAFGGSFTALYVKSVNADKMDEFDKKRLQRNIQLAEQLGAEVTITHGEDVSFQIAEYARISGVTQIVIGRSNIRRRHFWSKPTLPEKLTEIVPNLDIHIIPDGTIVTTYKASGESVLGKLVVPNFKDVFIMLLLLVAITLLGLVFYQLGFTEANVIAIYILGVLLISLFTRGYACGIVGSLMSVILFNFFFTEPRLTLHAYDSRYAVTFGIMLSVSIMTGTLASKLKLHAKMSAQNAFRTKVLLDTSLLLQKAQSDEEVINITATQLMKLLNRSIVVYTAKKDVLSKGKLFPVESEENNEELFNDLEYNAAGWVYKNHHRGGATTDVYKQAKCLYHAIRINDRVYGVIGVRMEKALDSFESSMLLSILGECALSMDNNRNVKEKEMAAVLAKNEQLRANLLRAISHDLRTPLTAISGNAENVLKNYEKLDADMRDQIFKEIFDDSQWLIGIVENLLSVTRIEEGRMNFNMSIQLMDEVINEALAHIRQKRNRHDIVVCCEDELLLAKMDAKLIVQVIINLVENAIKYTPYGTSIRIVAKKKKKAVAVSVIDDGPGIPKEIKPRVFDMFYTGENKIADSRRSLGLGLALCKSIINAHGGEITLTDNQPQGCNFTFTLPLEEVKIDE
ncbi:MAG: sensor histidine kinase KdpD [Lachnospiraceae bacterium]|nr:sensor histidine kinase KdpD [Lachnospiraceae bacterium]